MFFTVAVISENSGEIASTVCALLGGPGNIKIEPHIVAAKVLDLKRNEREHLYAGEEYGLRISESVDLRILDPRHIDLWIALDKKAQASAMRRVNEAGPAPGNFYRHIFPQPVVFCGFHVPSLQEHHGIYRSWFDALRVLFDPWKQKLWDAFCDSS